ncbi:MAG TPA: hypothetical protein VEG08_15090 [Terriglobales bacterium]|nr:hypothetical protein [Terriglobales bacterium]
MRLLAAALVGCLALGGATSCQAQIPLRLEPYESGPLPGVPQDWVSSEIHCDDDGNLYIYETLDDEANTSYVLRFDDHGQNLVRFEPGNVPELRKLADWGRIAIGPRGEVYLVASEVDEQENFVAAYVATFDRDGTFLRSTRVEGGVEPRALAAFGSGDWLISGWEHRDGKQLPVTAVFSERGQMQARVRMSGPKPKEAQRPPPEAEIQALVLSALAVRAGNGDVMVGQGGSVYEIAPSGEVVRHFAILAPKGTALRKVRPFAGQIALLFEGTADPTGSSAPGVLRIVDPLTGHTTAEYAADLSRLGRFACADDRGFSFVRSNQNLQLELVVARPQ